MPFRINLLGGNFDYSSGIHQTVIELRQNCLAVPGAFLLIAWVFPLVAAMSVVST
jgi:hypothetical protein